MDDVVRNGTRETCPVCGDDYTVELPHDCSVVASLEQQLADVGSINLRLMERLAELKARGDAMCRYSWYSYGTKCVYEDHFMEFEAALNNDKDEAGINGNQG